MNHAKLFLIFCSFYSYKDIIPVVDLEATTAANSSDEEYIEREKKKRKRKKKHQVAKKSTTPKKKVKIESQSIGKEDFSAFVNDINDTKNLSDYLSTTSDEDATMNPKPSSAPSSSSSSIPRVSGRASSVVAAAPVDNDTEESDDTVPLCSEPEVSSTSETHDLKFSSGVTLDEFLAKNETDFIKTEENYVPFSQ